MKQKEEERERKREKEERTGGRKERVLIGIEGS